MYTLYPSATRNALCVPNPDLLYADRPREKPGKRAYGVLSGTGLREFDLKYLRKKTKELEKARGSWLATPIPKIDRDGLPGETATSPTTKATTTTATTTTTTTKTPTFMTRGGEEGVKKSSKKEKKLATMTDQELKERKRHLKTWVRYLSEGGALVGKSGVKILITEAN